MFYMSYKPFITFKFGIEISKFQNKYLDSKVAKISNINSTFWSYQFSNVYATLESIYLKVQHSFNFLTRLNLAIDLQ